MTRLVRHITVDETTLFTFENHYHNFFGCPDFLIFLHYYILSISAGHAEELDRVSLSSPTSDQPAIRRQGSKMSYGSNDSAGSSTSTGILKVDVMPIAFAF